MEPSPKTMSGVNHSVDGSRDWLPFLLAICTTCPRTRLQLFNIRSVIASAHGLRCLRISKSVRPLAWGRIRPDCETSSQAMALVSYFVSADSYQIPPWEAYWP